MKRIIACMLCLALCVSMLTVFVYARDVSHENSVAEELKALNLFKGVSETNFDLNRAPTRIEALVMLIRVLGKEKEALSGRWSHPFKDVPQWADKYVGYAYANNLTNGISATEFGSGNASSAMYLTFVLRALGYSDANGKDFTWDNPYELADFCAILPPSVDIDNFLRADVVLISHAALVCGIVGENMKLHEKLAVAGVFTPEQYMENYDMFKHKVYSERYAAYDILRDFVVENGDFVEGEVYGLNSSSYILHFVNSEGGTEFNLEYVIYTATLKMQMKRYQSDGSSFEVSVLLNSESALGDGMRIVVEFVHGEEQMSGIGNVKPTTFKADTPIVYTMWPEWQHSTYYTKEDCEDISRIMLADMFDVVRSICKTYSVPITVADLGFESIF